MVLTTGYRMLQPLHFNAFLCKKLLRNLFKKKIKFKAQQTLDFRAQNRNLGTKAIFVFAADTVI